MDKTRQDGRQDKLTWEARQDKTRHDERQDKLPLEACKSALSHQNMGVDPNGIQSVQFTHERMSIVYKDVVLRLD